MVRCLTAEGCKFYSKIVILYSSAVALSDAVNPSEKHKLRLLIKNYCTYDMYVMY